MPNATAHALAGSNFSQNWTNTGLITTNNDWSNVPSIVGYRGEGLTSAIGADPQTLTADISSSVYVLANKTNANLTTGGVGEFQLSNPVIALQGSGTADAPNIVLNLDATGRKNLTVSYTLRDIDGSVNNAVSPVALQYRVGSSGVWTNVAAGFVADASQGPYTSGLETAVSAVLPSAANNQALVQVRVITSNAAGYDEWIGIDDIGVTSAAMPVVTVEQVKNAEEAGDAGTFRFTRTGDTSQALSVNYTVGGTATSGTDYQALSGKVTFAAGASAADVSVTAIVDAFDDGDDAVIATISTGTGYLLGDVSSASVTVSNPDATFVLPNGTFGAITYTGIGSQVDGSLAFQSVPLTNFNLNLGGQDFREGMANYTVTPSAQFEYGQFVGITFALDTSASGLYCSSISMSSMVVNGIVAATGNAFLPCQVVANASTVKITKATPKTGGKIDLNYEWKNCIGASKITYTVVIPGVNGGNDQVVSNELPFQTTNANGTDKRVVIANAVAGTTVKVTITVLDANGMPIKIANSIATTTTMAMLK